LSIRLPPKIKANDALELVKKKLSTDVPYNCKVEFSNEISTDGWTSPDQSALE
jgi:hypothetical protein